MQRRKRTQNVHSDDVNARDNGSHRGKFYVTPRRRLMLLMAGEEEKTEKKAIFGKNSICIVIIVITGVLLFLSVGLLICGVLLYQNLPSISTDTKPVFDLLTYDGENLDSYAVKIASLFIAIGVISLVATGAVFGLYIFNISNKYIKTVLIVLAVILVLLIFMNVTGIALWKKYEDSVSNSFSNGDFQSTFNTSLVNDFREDSITSAFILTNAWNKVFIERQCCAVTAVPAGTRGDFLTSYWKESGAASSQKIPTSCCVGVTVSSYTATTTCKDVVNAGSYHPNGCLSTLKSVFNFDNYSRALLGLTICLSILEFAAIALMVAEMFFMDNHIKVKQESLECSPRENTRLNKNK